MIIAVCRHQEALTTLMFTFKIRQFKWNIRQFEWKNNYLVSIWFSFSVVIERTRIFIFIRLDIWNWFVFWPNSIFFLILRYYLVKLNSRFSMTYASIDWIINRNDVSMIHHIQFINHYYNCYNNFDTSGCQKWSFNIQNSRIVIWRQWNCKSMNDGELTR